MIFKSAARRRCETNESRIGTQEGRPEQFLNYKTLSGDGTEEESEFLKALNFKGAPPPMYYHQQLQSLRGPLHFPTAARPLTGHGLRRG
jgi:hypothetical protein